MNRHPVKGGFLGKSRNQSNKFEFELERFSYLSKNTLSLYFVIRLLIGVILVIAFQNLIAQHTVIDSLTKSLERTAESLERVGCLNLLSEKLQYHDPARARFYIDESIQLAQKIHDNLGLAVAYRIRGVLYADRQVLDSAKLFYNKAYALVKGHNKKPFLKQAGLLSHNYGVLFHYQQYYDSATIKYLQAVTIFEKIDEQGLSFFPYTNLAAIYSFLKDHKKAIYYSSKSTLAAHKLNDPSKVILATNTEMSARLEAGLYDSVLIKLRENLAKAKLREEYYQIGKAENLIAQYHARKTLRFDSAIYYQHRALKNIQKIGNQYEESGMFQNLGHYYSRYGMYDSSVYFLEKAIQLSKALALDNVVQYSLSNLVDTYEQMGNTRKALQTLKEYLIVNDSVHLKNNQQQVNELEAKYEAERKELQIQQLQAESQVQSLRIQRKNAVLIFSFSALLVLGALFFLLRHNYEQRRNLQLQKITELEKDKMLITTEAVLRGEEQERTRLAKDLHDGLGGMLSGTKYALNTLKENLIMTADNMQLFERSLDMLDSSIKEMRQIAHNMMPETLIRFGLNAALKDFCEDINKSGMLPITYQSLGWQEDRIDQTISITIFRIAQELITNIIKHSGAKNAIVQLTKNNAQLVLTVEDNGHGFDPAILKSTKGIGWTNIIHRIDFLKGKLDVDSNSGNGTSVQIEFDIYEE